MNFIKMWAHEIVMAAVAIWYAIGMDGQNGLINLAKTFLSNHGWTAGVLVIGSMIVARLRQVPSTDPAANPSGMGMKSTGAMLLVIALAGSMTACSSPQTTAQGFSRALSALLDIVQAEEPVLPPADAAIVAPWVGLGQTLEGQLNTCITAAGNKGSALITCFNTFAGGLLNPAELAQLRVLSPSARAKVQLWATAVIVGVNGANAAFGGASTAQPIPVISANSASMEDLHQLKSQVLFALQRN